MEFFLYILAAIAVLSCLALIIIGVHFSIIIGKILYKGFGKSEMFND